MILKSTKFGENRTKDVEVGPDGQPGRFLYTPQTMGGITMNSSTGATFTACYVHLCEAMINNLMAYFCLICSL